jgi:hypothetical protein
MNTSMRTSVFSKKYDDDNPDAGITDESSVKPKGLGATGGLSWKAHAEATSGRHIQALHVWASQLLRIS